MTATDPRPAVIAKRVDEGVADTAEITDLATAAGYRVVETVTQSRPEDAEFNLGAGKVDELVSLVGETGAATVLFDNRLGPYQTYNLGTRLPDGTEVIDRFTLILQIFGQRAETRKAQLQVELAELRYELPRAEAKASLAKRAETRKAQLQVELAELRYELPRAEAKTSLATREEHPGFMGLGEYDEGRERDIKARISRIRDELARIEKTDQQRREQRRERGFDLVALAGYTNAGKSTLLHRLAADLEVGQHEGRHPDLHRTAEAQDRLFTTLGTTTRRMSMDRRDVLLTDTVGFIAELPHWLVESFKSTLDSVYRADLVLLVVDVTDPMDAIREKLATSHDTLYERNEAPIVTVLNKTDAVDDAELAEKTRALQALAPDPVAVSAETGWNIGALEARIHEELPERERERLVLPLTDGAMSLVSWLYDHAHVETEDYGADQVVLAFEARPAVVEKARAKAGDLAAAAESA